MAQDNKGRRFAQNLIGVGSAAKVRENVSAAVRETTILSKPKLTEPLDYENVLVKNKTLLHNDPQRELLIFPLDDVSTSHIPRKFRTVGSPVSEEAKHEAKGLLVKECIKSYTANWSRVHYKYSAYSGSFGQLPNLKLETQDLPKQVFEVDEDDEKSEDDSFLKMSIQQQITKKGWLYKGPDSGTESGFTAFTRSFKRRFFYLKQQADTTYVMEFHKDDKKLEAKGAIFLDSALSVAKTSKRAGKPTMEIHMQDKSVYTLAADSDLDLDSWIVSLKKVIQNNESGSERYSDCTPTKSENFQQSLEHSMNPELQRYARETDSLLAQQRKEGRQKLFRIYPDVQKRLAEPSQDRSDQTRDRELYKEVFGQRFIIQFESFQPRLQANLDERGGDRMDNPEPFFISFALYDARYGCKVSEDFHFDPNSDDIRGLLPGIDCKSNGQVNGSVNGNTSPINGIDPDWLKYPKKGVFSVMNAHPEIFLVARIEKVLNGSISSAAEPYAKTPDVKMGTKVHKQMKLYCARLGQYRMPFAWAARPIFKMSKSTPQQISQLNDLDSLDTERPVFKPFTVELDTYADFAIYRAEGNRISEEDLIKNLQDFKKPEKQGKWQPIYASLEIKLNPYEDSTDNRNLLSTSLVPVKPFPMPPPTSPTLEVCEFVSAEGKFAHPYATYLNHLYIYPKTIKFDTQKAFTKARNIACQVEVRETDEESSQPLRCIYGKHGTEVLTSSALCAVVHHNSSPDFQEEVKIILPTQLHGRHHLVFTFYHISCDLSKDRTSKTSTRKGHPTEMIVGYAWYPLLDDRGRVNVGLHGEEKCLGEQQLRVATNLPVGYLGHESFGLNKGASGPDVRWVDSGKPLLKFNVRLVSTIYTKDPHLHNFFSHCQDSSKRNGASSPGSKVSSPASVEFESANRLKLHGKVDLPVTITLPGSKGTPYDQQMMLVVKGLHATDPSTLINFLPTILNQLFRLLVSTTNDEVAINAVRVLIHIVNCVHKENKPEILKTYVKYVFVTEPAVGSKDRTVHEQLASNLKAILRPTQTDQLVIGKFMNHSWFFFEILIKSMAQHLLSTGRIKMSRHERFSSDYQFHMSTLTQTLATHITQKYSELPAESKNANQSLADFIKRCFTFMDRGFVFRLVNTCVETFCTKDATQMQTYKFEFLRGVCEHEHYIPLNLPLMKKPVKNYKDLKHDYTLSEDFRKNHFLVGLLLQEVKQALNEVRDVRKVAVATLRNQLAKHAYDDRYQGKNQQARIATLYLPFLMVILENKHRLTPKETLPSPSTNQNADNADIPSSANNTLSRATVSSVDTSSLDSSSASGSQSRSSASLPRYQKDPSVFALIAGQVSSLNSLNDISSQRASQHGSSSSLNSAGSVGSTDTMTGLDLDRDSTRGSERSGSSHRRSGSITGQSTYTSPMGVMRYDKLDQQEIKDLLISFLYVTANLTEDVLLGWFNNSSEFDVIDFFEVLEICLEQFKYMGKKRIATFSIIGSPAQQPLSAKKGHSSRASRTSSMVGPEMMQQLNNGGGHVRLFAEGVIAKLSKIAKLSCRRHYDYGLSILSSCPASVSSSEVGQMEANLSSEVAMVVMDVVALYTQSFKDKLQSHDGDNSVMHKVFDLHLCFLHSSQSQNVQKNAFAAIRAYINKFPKVLFQGDASMCGKLCYEILKACNMRMTSSRSEACALMYLLMRSNFEFCKRRSFNRVHLQMIVAVSQLVNDVIALNNSRFIESLSVINSYAHNDKAMKATPFPKEVKDLTKRIRTVLMATAQMREYQNNPEMYIDLQYSLAKSYTSTPELRKTWLESMAKKHLKYENYSEAAHCYLHIAALVAEYLKRRGEFPQGCRVFSSISHNVETEEAGMKDDLGIQDVHYTEDNLTAFLEECAQLFEKAERYEILGELYRLIIPIYERKRDFERLAGAYGLLHQAYNKVVEVTRSGKRMLGKYYRVKFYGQAYFGEEARKEYIYKEPKVTGLHDVCHRLQSLYTKQFGEGRVKLIQDSNKVNEDSLDSSLAYIQISHATPYFEEGELENKVTDFERNSNVRSFMYETPFTKDGKAHGEIEDQWKRRTILTTMHAFPYVKKRVLVEKRRDTELSPIDCAIDQMSNKVTELNDVVYKTSPDVKKLQLTLSGSVSAQVNAGPMAFAEAFLKPGSKYGPSKVEQLKGHFREFVNICHTALDMNSQLIKSDQLDYQDILKKNFHEMVLRLSAIFDEQLLTELDMCSDAGSRISVASNTSSIG